MEIIAYSATAITSAITVTTAALGRFEYDGVIRRKLSNLLLHFFQAKAEVSHHPGRITRFTYSCVYVLHIVRDINIIKTVRVVNIFEVIRTISILNTSSNISGVDGFDVPSLKLGFDQDAGHKQWNDQQL